MSLVSIPEWILKSPYLIREPEWHMSEDAPLEIKEKFEEWAKLV